MNYEAVFDDIRKYSKYCTRCKRKLDLPWSDWHMPFCQKCRKEIIESKIKRRRNQ